ncbi:hypothetical protein C0J52_26979 [Blattella germanica]|nr:hypothetical protein C0J52_26979 [Blattella germanica]
MFYSCNIIFNSLQNRPRMAGEGAVFRTCVQSKFNNLKNRERLIATRNVGDIWHQQFLLRLNKTWTGELEVNFCRKRFHIQHHKRILKERYMHAVQCTQRRCAKQNLPQVREEHSAHHRLPEADKFLESYHREKTRDERQLARLQAREKSRDVHRRGLICIDTDLLSHMQRIPIPEEESMEMIESQLLDLNN